MKIKIDTILKNEYNEEYVDGESKLSIRKVLITSLANIKSEDPMMSYKLVKKIMSDNSEVELELEEIVFIKNSILQSNWVPFIIGQTVEAIEGKN